MQRKESRKALFLTFLNKNLRLHWRSSAKNIENKVLNNMPVMKGNIKTELIIYNLASDHLDQY